jgi:hypothetical protein
MLNEKKGINQKIIDLQHLQAKKEKEKYLEVSGYSHIEGSEKSSNRNFAQVFNPRANETNRTAKKGTS